MNLAFLPCDCVGVKNTLNTSPLGLAGVPALTEASSFIYHCLCNIHLNVSAVKKASYLSIIMKIVLTYDLPEWVSGIPVLQYMGRSRPSRS